MKTDLSTILADFWIQIAIRMYKNKIINSPQSIAFQMWIWIQFQILGGLIWIAIT